jgi:hypothetical protein
MRYRPSLAVFLAVAVAGCGGPSNSPPTTAALEENVLSDVGEMYRAFTAEKKKPPVNLADLTPMEMMCPAGVRAVKTGEVIVQYGATLPDTEEGVRGSSDEVLAFMKEVPTSGGQVLMLNRALKTMTADEFKSAKLAGTASSSAQAASTNAPAK